MGWYIARSLDQLLNQVNARAPHRSKASDGGIGDARHSANLSDHNPTAAGQVCARDFTNDPVGGLDAQWLADRLVDSRDSRIKYIISRGRIIDSRVGQHPWQWMPYNGSNRHDKHVHVSVFAGARGDDTRAWNLGPNATPQEDDMPDNATIKQLVKDALVEQKGNDGRSVLDRGIQNAWDIAAVGAKVDALAGALAAATKDPGITLESMSAVLNEAVDRNLGNIEIRLGPADTAGGTQS